MQNETDLYPLVAASSYSAIDFVIGLLITLAASVINALGLNVTKLDHTRQEVLPLSRRRPDWKRVLWWIGMILYISSQLLGSTLALEYLRAEYVAPLGATSLIFNFIFAYLLVGTLITRMDIIGTFIIVIGVIGVVLFGNQRDSSADVVITLAQLKLLWSRLEWIIYFSLGECVTAILAWVSSVVDEVKERRIADERVEMDGDEVVLEGMRRSAARRLKPSPDASVWVKASHAAGTASEAHLRFRSRILARIERFTASQPDLVLKKLSGFFWSFTGGLLASQTLIFAKSIVKLLSGAIASGKDGTVPDGGGALTSPLTWIILVVLVVAAVSQVYCLNASLKSYDSTFCIPIFFATYTIFGFINSLVYLDELHTYQLWAFLCIWISIGVLVTGVVLLSLKKQPPSAAPPSPTLPSSAETPSALEEATGTDPFADSHTAPAPASSVSAATATFEQGEGDMGGSAIGRFSDRVGTFVERGIQDKRVKEKRGFLAQFVRFGAAAAEDDGDPLSRSRSPLATATSNRSSPASSTGRLGAGVGGGDGVGHSVGMGAAGSTSQKDWRTRKGVQRLDDDDGDADQGDEYKTGDEDAIELSDRIDSTSSGAPSSWQDQQRGHADSFGLDDFDGAVIVEAAPGYEHTRTRVAGEQVVEEDDPFGDFEEVKR